MPSSVRRIPATVLLTARHARTKTATHGTHTCKARHTRASPSLELRYLRFLLALRALPAFLGCFVSPQPLTPTGVVSWISAPFCATNSVGIDNVVACASLTLRVTVFLWP